MANFKLVSPYKPTGDQPQAIEKLVEGILKGYRYQTLLGVTGSGKTFTIAHVIARVGKPTLVISHNKTLAAQLYGEFKSLFPENAVEYFISYYDYYQPEAYIPQTDTYIEKEVDINQEIDRLRLKATSALLERDDVIVVASVSCIYGIGSPQEVKKRYVVIEKGQELERDLLLRRLVDIYYTRNDISPERGTFRARGDVVEVVPAYEEKILRVEFWGDQVERIQELDPLTRKVVAEKEKVAIYPAKHFLVPPERIEEAIEQILQEMEERVAWFRSQGKFLEAQRLETRTRYDMELLRETGYCPGIENYSRYLSGRRPGERPATLLDYFPDDFLTVIDESHVTVPQLRGMYAGDRSRKEVLIEHGFRLPSALDNRPLFFEEFEALVKQVIFVSATPGPYELEKSKGRVVEQIIRPTGLVDPEVEVRPAEGQVDDLLEEVRRRAERGERSLVTTLTKKMAEDLAEYMSAMGLKVRYLHSEIEALERMEILRDLRLGKFDVLVGVNLLREGLDLPEVSLVAILDADKEGFLRSERSLIQTAGRAARNVNGKVILYADRVTDSMQRAIEETERRRRIQEKYNRKHGITPRSIYKSVEEILKTTAIADVWEEKEAPKVAEKGAEYIPEGVDLEEYIAQLEAEMYEAAEKLEFERAATIRDRIRKLESRRRPKVKGEVK